MSQTVSGVPSVHLTRLRTGVESLDRVMQGGFPVGSVSVLAGEPGTGKTVLALQTLFAAARDGKKCIYFTTLSEPSLKLLRYMQLFEFFDDELLDAHVVLRDLGPQLRAQDPEAALKALSDEVARHEPELVVVDSFKPIHDLIADPSRVRTFTYDLAVQMAGWGATTLLLGEYEGDDLGTYPEFAIADGILRLGVARQELARVRELEIRKLRGSGFVTGVHFFEIDQSGISFYPRVRGPEGDVPDPVSPQAGPVPTGTPGLDELLEGGFPPASGTFVMGGTGTGKTALSLQFLVEGARRGEVGVLFTLEESLDQLRTIAGTYGFDLAALEKKGLLHLSYTAPVELSTDRFLNNVRALTERIGASRAVLDSLTSLSLGAVSDRRYKELVYALGKHFRRLGVTAVSTLEVPQLLGAPQLTSHGISFAADNVVQLRYVEMEGRLGRAISVLKARGVNIVTELRPMTITSKGLEVGSAGELKSLQGVLTGLPTVGE